ncbi:MAG: thiamine-phosphate kinase [Hyphomonadaceae bacterium]|nr:thiamine-phosphate kinase [Hyphomonadaceae bacterium]
MDEIDLIETLFAPLARDPGARALRDDAATIEGAFVVTADALVECVHFLPDDPLDLVARKALRVNLSDLAAKGAQPFAILLSLMWPDVRSERDLALFAAGLGADLDAYGATLLGGDTTATPGPLSVAVTAFGKPFAARTPSRSDARVGDDVWVTGAIGDAGLGLIAARGDLPGLSPEDRAALIARYRLPAPPVCFASAIAAHARASMDVSDGLIGDAAKLAAASGLRLRLEAAAVPLSPVAQRAAAMAGLAGPALVDRGDDYEILFTAAAAARAAILAAAAAAGVVVTRIGAVETGTGVAWVSPDGAVATFARGGYRHRLGGQGGA